MGEAKRRRLAEKNFGRVPKTAGTRGLVVSPQIEIEGPNLFAKSSNLDPQELRFALLFWDKLVWPSSKALYFANGPDEGYLEDAKILFRPEYTFYGDVAQGIAKGQIQAYIDLERSEPGAWALSLGENSLLLRDGLAEDGTGAFVELHRAIPIPKHDVALEEILEFKHRRYDELVLLRYLLESLVSKINQSEDRPQALEKYISEVDRACADLLIVGKEWSLPFYISNIKASFNLTPSKFLPAIAGGWKIGEKYSLAAATTAAIAAGIASTIEIKGDIGLRSMDMSKNPYRYAYRIHKELI